MTEAAETTEAAAIDLEPKFEWAIVEIFGHRRHAGRTIEEERFGAKMLRVDVPIDGAPETKGWRTFYYSGGAIFSFTLTDEASVLKANKTYEPAARYSLEDHSDDEDEGDYA